MRRFIITLVIAAVLGVGSLFPMARSAHAESPWIYAGSAWQLQSGDYSSNYVWYYNTQSGKSHCSRNAR